MPSPVIRISIAADDLDPAAEIAAFRCAHAASGAVAAFIGQVRAEAGDVVALTLEHYAGFSEAAIEAIAAEACRRWPLDGLAVIHRVGDLAPGAPIVVVAAAAAHRRAAFDAVDFMMDYLKSDAPLWKRETTKRGASWIEPTASDRQDKRRWSQASEQE
jgi:molybdopterin synthase catalytic subunit